MATQSTSTSVGVGSSNEPTIVEVLETTRNKEIWQHYDLCKMSDGSKKGRCKLCGKFISSSSNSTLRQHYEKKYCPVLKIVPDAGQASMSQEGDLFAYEVDRVRQQFASFVIQEAPSSSSISSSTSIFHKLRQESVKRSRSDNTGTNEFGRYTGTDWIIFMEQKEFNNFDILSLWKGRHSLNFHSIDLGSRFTKCNKSFLSVLRNPAFSTSGRVLSIRRTRLIPASFEMCICLKGHLDAQERIQHTSNIEDNCLEIEHQLCKVEAEVGYVISIADEEIVLDDQAMSGSGSGDSE
ncbi:zinc finger BED domain-containing protein RICESLEEPER 2 [Tanacetum coccineum]